MNFKGLNICVLQPDYSTSTVDYKNYDPKRNLSHLIPEANFTHIFLNKLSTYAQLKKLKKQNFDIFVNLCEGYLEWSIPSIDVIFNLDLLNLPYSGSTLDLYDPPKKIMKYVAYCQNVNTPKYLYINKKEALAELNVNIPFPLFVKPGKAGDSLGIDKNSKVENILELKNQALKIFEEFDDVLIEEYIPGREFTVLVIADPFNKKHPLALEPIEYNFPLNYEYKTYSLKTSELHPLANKPCFDTALSNRLKEASIKIFNGFEGKGYARLDFRLSADNILYFLEINFACSVFYTNGMEGSADFILQNNSLQVSGFLKKIIEEGITRFKSNEKLFEIIKTENNGYGIFANQDIPAETLIFKGEGKPHRLVSLDYVNQNWTPDEIKDFKRYAYPIANNIYVLWDSNPNEWAPQNHCCDPNTYYKGLDVYSSKNIYKNEELTLNYKSFLDSTMEPFECNCNSENCRGEIKN
ncbi:MAG: hypothetical protein ORN85_08955 [Sediminibacterium sp.]|nr:hypothetical protein [Sediminibacterium sp.]